MALRILFMPHPERFNYWKVSALYPVLKQLLVNDKLPRSRTFVFSLLAGGSG